MIKAVVAGGTGGVMSMPLEELDGYEFTYPTGIKGLKIGYNKVFGYYIEVPKGQVSLVKEELGSCKINGINEQDYSRIKSITNKNFFKDVP